MKAQLNRKLTLFPVTNIVIANMIGAGIFTTSGLLMKDLQNPHDPMALLMRTDDPVSLVGYAPKYFSAEFTDLIDKVSPDKVEVSVEQVNLDAPIQYRVLCRLRAPWPDGFSPCSLGPFKALA